MTDADEFVLETMQCATNTTGETVAVTMGGGGFQHRYLLPINRLGVVIEQLLKVYNTARASGALAHLAQQDAVPPPRPVIETFLVNAVTVVYSEAGPVTVRVVSRDGPRDIVFQSEHWIALQSATPDAADAIAGPAKH